MAEFIPEPDYLMPNFHNLHQDMIYQSAMIYSSH